MIAGGDEAVHLGQVLASGVVPSWPGQPTLKVHTGARPGRGRCAGQKSTASVSHFPA